MRNGGYRGVVRKTSNLPHWNTVLRRWVTEMDRLSNFVLPIYELREIANFSLLTQAANRVPKYIAVPEIPDYDYRMGYYDCVLQHPDGIDVVEGKFAWLKMPALRHVPGTFKKADLQLKRRKQGNWVARNRGVANYVAVLFGSVGCTVPDNEKELRRQIEDTVDQFRSVDCDALAYCFPKSRITVKGEHYNNYISPGGVVIVRKLRSRRN